MTTALSPSVRRTAVVVTALMALVATGACSLGDRQAMANRVIAAAKRTGSGGVVRATVSVNVKVIPTKLPVAPGPPKISSGSAPNLAAIIDFGAGRAALGIPTGDVAHAAALFDGTRMFERRDVKLPAQAAAAVAGAPSNIALLAVAATTPPPAAPPVEAPPADGQAAATRLKRPSQVQRRWLAFDFAGLDKKDSTRVAGSFAISPIAIWRLAVGALPGSMKVAGTETVGGGGTTHYRMNVSRDKAERGLPESDRKQLDKMFRANSVGGDVFPAEAWVDSDGRLRRFSVRLGQSLSRTDRDDLTVTIEAQEFAVAVAVPLPDPKETATVRDLGQLVHAAVGT